MKDFYGKRRQGKETNYQAEILSAASSKEGVLQQARRFRNGPHGLQELAKKRKRQGSATQKLQSSPPLDAACIDARRDAQEASPQFLFAQAEGGEGDRFTLSGNCRSQSLDGSGDAWPVQGNASDLDSRPQFIGYDPLASVLRPGDPFDTLPLPNCARTQILIYHGEYLHSVQ